MLNAKLIWLLEWLRGIRLTPSTITILPASLLTPQAIPRNDTKHVKQSKALFLRPPVSAAMTAQQLERALPSKCLVR